MTGRPDSKEAPAGENVLVLIRHGESEWNRLNRFTGWKDVGLTEEGMAEAHLAGAMLATEWHTLYPKTPEDLVPSAYSISGVFDLTPLVQVDGAAARYADRDERVGERADQQREHALEHRIAIPEPHRAR